MREFMRDHVMSELLGADRQLQPQHHTATAAAWWPGRRHPQGPAFFGRIVVESDPKPRIIQKITLHVLRQTMQHGQDATFQIGMIFEIFQQGGEDLSYLSKRKPCIFWAKPADCRSEATKSCSLSSPAYASGALYQCSALSAKTLD